MLSFALGCREAPDLFGCQKACATDPAQTARAVTVGGAADLFRLRPGVPYKFIVAADGHLRIAPLPKSLPRNPFHHPVLAGGAPVRTGGTLTFEHDGRAVTRLVVDQDTKGYCVPFESLAAAREALVAAGLAHAVVALEDRPPGCAPSRVRK
jgi:hypothetical protein